MASGLLSMPVMETFVLSRRTPFFWVYGTAKLIWALVPIACLLWASPRSVEAATRYVDSAATGSNNGTSWANAWTSLASVSSVSAGDTVYISGGSAGNTKTYNLSSGWNPPSGTTGNRITYKIGQEAGHNGTVIFSGSGTWLYGPSNINMSGDAGDGLRHFRLSGYSTLAGSIDRTGLSYLDCPSGLGVAYNAPFRLTGATDMEVDHCYFKVTVVNNGHFIVWHSMVGAGYDVSKVHDNTILVPYQGGGYGSDGLYIDGDGFSIYNNLIQAYYAAGANGDHADGWQGAGGRYIKIYNNVIVDFANYGLFGEAYATGYSDTLVYNNLVLISDSDILSGYPGGIIFGTSSGYHGPSPCVFDNVVIANNTIVDFDDHMVIALNNVTGYPTTFKDCYIQNNAIVGSGSILIQGNTTSTVDHNDWNSVGDAPSKFVTYTPYGGTDNDLHLLVGATDLVDAGVSHAGSFTIDKDGYTRTGTWDIGAYEYTSGTNPPPPDTTAPLVTFASPVAGAVIVGTVNLNASASDNAGGSGVASVTFLVDGVVAGTATTVPYTLAWRSASVANGGHTILARAQDVAGNQASSTAVNVSVQNVSDTSPPSVSLTAPAAHAVISNTVTLTASASDNPGGSGVARVTFLVDGVVVGSTTTSPRTLDWSSGLVTNGSHTIQATAQDIAGNQAFSATVSVTVQNVQPQAATVGLIGSWEFNAANGTTVPDSSGQGNDGTLVAPAKLSQGMLGFDSGLILDGTNGYVRVASSPALEQVTNAVTMSVWAEINSTADMQTIARKVFSETVNPYPYSAYDLVIDDQGSTFRPRMGVTRADLTRGLAYGAPHPYGGLYHFAGTYDGRTLRIYVNGVLEGSAAFTGAITQSSQPLCIGRYGTVAETVKGSLRKFRLYNRALSAAEIQALATRPVPPSGFGIAAAH